EIEDALRRAIGLVALARARGLLLALRPARAALAVASAVARRRVRPPRVRPPLDAARRELPLRLGGQPPPAPPAKALRLREVHAVHRVVQRLARGVIVA